MQGFAVDVTKVKLFGECYFHANSHQTAYKYSYDGNKLATLRADKTGLKSCKHLGKRK